jgi:hypothetical protein
MEDLGYHVEPVKKDYVSFVHPDRELDAFVRNISPDDEVRPIDLLSVRKTLINDGVIKSEQEFDELISINKGDRLIWTDPKSGREIEVIAAAGETTDGLVFIKQKGGAFSPCPVEQLRPAGKSVVHN